MEAHNDNIGGVDPMNSVPVALQGGREAPGADEVLSFSTQAPRLGLKKDASIPPRFKMLFDALRGVERVPPPVGSVALERSASGNEEVHIQSQAAEGDRAAGMAALDLWLQNGLLSRVAAVGGLPSDMLNALSADLLQRSDLSVMAPPADILDRVREIQRHLMKLRRTVSDRNVFIKESSKKSESSESNEKPPRDPRVAFFYGPLDYAPGLDGGLERFTLSRAPLIPDDIAFIAMTPLEDLGGSHEPFGSLRSLVESLIPNYSQDSYEDRIRAHSPDVWDALVRECPDLSARLEDLPKARQDRLVGLSEAWGIPLTAREIAALTQFLNHEPVGDQEALASFFTRLFDGYPKIVRSLGRALDPKLVTKDESVAPLRRILVMPPSCDASTEALLKELFANPSSDLPLLVRSSAQAFDEESLVEGLFDYLGPGSQSSILESGMDLHATVDALQNGFDRRHELASALWRDESLKDDSTGPISLERDVGEGSVVDTLLYKGYKPVKVLHFQLPLQEDMSPQEAELIDRHLTLRRYFFKALRLRLQRMDKFLEAKEHEQANALLNEIPDVFEGFFEELEGLRETSYGPLQDDLVAEVKALRLQLVSMPDDETRSQLIACLAERLDPLNKEAIRFSPHRSNVDRVLENPSLIKAAWKPRVNPEEGVFGRLLNGLRRRLHRFDDAPAPESGDLKFINTGHSPKAHARFVERLRAPRYFVAEVELPDEGPYIIARDPRGSGARVAVPVDPYAGLNILQKKALDSLQSLAPFPASFPLDPSKIFANDSLEALNDALSAMPHLEAFTMEAAVQDLSSGDSIPLSSLGALFARLLPKGISLETPYDRLSEAMPSDLSFLMGSGALPEDVLRTRNVVSREMLERYNLAQLWDLESQDLDGVVDILCGRADPSSESVRALALKILRNFSAIRNRLNSSDSNPYQGLIVMDPYRQSECDPLSRWLIEQLREDPVQGQPLVVMAMSSLKRSDTLPIELVEAQFNRSVDEWLDYVDQVADGEASADDWNRYRPYYFEMRRWARSLGRHPDYRASGAALESALQKVFDRWFGEESDETLDGWMDSLLDDRAEGHPMVDLDSVVLFTVLTEAFARQGLQACAFRDASQSDFAFAFVNRMQRYLAYAIDADSGVDKQDGLARSNLMDLNDLMASFLMTYCSHIGHDVHVGDGQVLKLSEAALALVDRYAHIIGFPVDSVACQQSPVGTAAHITNLYCDNRDSDFARDEMLRLSRLRFNPDSDEPYSDAYTMMLLQSGDLPEDLVLDDNERWRRPGFAPICSDSLTLDFDLLHCVIDPLTRLADQGKLTADQKVFFEHLLDVYENRLDQELAEMAFRRYFLSLQRGHQAIRIEKQADLAIAHYRNARDHIEDGVRFPHLASDRIRVQGCLIRDCVFKPTQKLVKTLKSRLVDDPDSPEVLEPEIRTILKGFLESFVIDVQAQKEADVLGSGVLRGHMLNFKANQLEWATQFIAFYGFLLEHFTPAYLEDLLEEINVEVHGLSQRAYFYPPRGGRASMVDISVFNADRPDLLSFIQGVHQDVLAFYEGCNHHFTIRAYARYFPQYLFGPALQNEYLNEELTALRDEWEEFVARRSAEEEAAKFVAPAAK